jgi:hypothetical protein
MLEHDACQYPRASPNRHPLPVDQRLLVKNANRSSFNERTQEKLEWMRVSRLETDSSISVAMISISRETSLPRFGRGADTLIKPRVKRRGGRTIWVSSPSLEVATADLVAVS